MYTTIVTKQYVPFGSGLPRSPGLHLTDIIQSLRDTLGLGKVAEGWDMGVAADAGFLWEEAFSLAYRDKHAQEIMRPGELVMDGIIMSPDGWGPDPDGKLPLVDHEYKFTWRSSNKTPGEDFYWRTQFACYCRAMGTIVTVLHAFYTMGNYRGSGPHPEDYRIEFDEKEIESTWQMVVRHAKEKGWL